MTPGTVYLVGAGPGDPVLLTVRAAELQRWVASGEYAKILAGEYPRRGAPRDGNLGDDYVDAAGYYGAKTRETFQQFGDAFNRARDAFSSTWRGGGSGSTSGQ